MCLFGIILVKNHFFHPKKSIFVYLDNLLKIIIFLKKSVFNFFVEAEKSSFWKKKSIFSLFSYI